MSREVRYRARGFSLIEAAVSVVLVGVLFVASLEVVAQTAKGRTAMAERASAHALAESLLAEVLAKPYDDPSETDTTFGPTAAELAASGGAGVSRSAFDDVRDYDGWSASPPRQRDGTKITDATGMAETIKVVYVALADLSTSVVADTGTLKITVTMTGRDGRTLAQLTAIRTRAASQMEGVQ